MVTWPHRCLTKQTCVHCSTVFTAALCSLYNCVHCSTVFIADCVHCSTLHVQTPASRVRSLPDNYRWLSKPLGSWREIASAWLLFQLLKLHFLPQYFPAQKASRDELMSPFLCAFACLGACMASVCAWDYLCVGGREREKVILCVFHCLFGNWKAHRGSLDFINNFSQKS